MIGQSLRPGNVDADPPWLIRISCRRAENAVTALENCLDEVRSVWRQFGLVLVRGMDLHQRKPIDLDGVGELIVGASPQPYREQSSPRSALGPNIFSSTHYPAHAELHLHNELSYAAAWPTALLFYCVRPADTGGATTFADCHAVNGQIPPDLAAEFTARRWSYVRNLRGSAGLDWQTVFQSSSRDDVENYCQANDIEVCWLADGARLRAVRPATAIVSGRGLSTTEVWFNHIAAWHISTLPADTSSALRRLFRDEELPVNTYYGDGEPIQDRDVRLIREAYQACAFDIHWQHGDLAVVDNSRVAHGRRAYTGSRSLLVVLVGEQRRRGGSAHAV